MFSRKLMMMRLTSMILGFGPVVGTTTFGFHHLVLLRVPQVLLRGPSTSKDNNFCSSADVGKCDACTCSPVCGLQVDKIFMGKV